MAGNEAAPSRLVNFVSEEQLAESRRTRGERVEDGTAQRDRPLFEILKENKDKQDAEFNERFKHRPPKALDEDETEFLDKLETSQKEYERQLADEEALELRRFQAAVAEKSLLVYEQKEEPAPAPSPYVQESKGKRTKKQLPGMVIKVIPQPKRAKLDSSTSVPQRIPSESGNSQTPTPEVANASSDGGTATAAAVDKLTKPTHTEAETNKVEKLPDVVAKTCLVSYSDESDED